MRQNKAALSHLDTALSMKSLSPEILITRSVCNMALCDWEVSVSLPIISIWYSLNSWSTVSAWKPRTLRIIVIIEYLEATETSSNCLEIILLVDSLV